MVNRFLVPVKCFCVSDSQNPLCFVCLNKISIFHSFIGGVIQNRWSDCAIKTSRVYQCTCTHKSLLPFSAKHAPNIAFKIFSHLKKYNLIETKVLPQMFSFYLSDVFFFIFYLNQMISSSWIQCFYIILRNSIKTEEVSDFLHNYKHYRQH